MVSSFDGLFNLGPLIEAAYWDGAKDGAILSAVVLVILYLFSHDNDK